MSDRSVVQERLDQVDPAGGVRAVREALERITPEDVERSLASPDTARLYEVVRKLRELAEEPA
jgi:hypothetical protein